MHRAPTPAHASGIFTRLGEWELVLWVTTVMPEASASEQSQMSARASDSNSRTARLAWPWDSTQAQTSRYLSSAPSLVGMPSTPSWPPIHSASGSLCLLGSSRTVWHRTAVPLVSSSPSLTQKLGNMSSGMWFSLVMKMFESSR